MPMQMRDLVAKAGEIDFVGRESLAHDLFHSKDNFHQCSSLIKSEVSHFSNMRQPYDSGKSGKQRVLRIDDCPVVGSNQLAR